MRNRRTDMSNFVSIHLARPISRHRPTFTFQIIHSVNYEMPRKDKNWVVLKWFFCARCDLVSDSHRYMKKMMGSLLLCMNECIVGGVCRSKGRYISSWVHGFNFFDCLQSHKNNDAELSLWRIAVNYIKSVKKWLTFETLRKRKTEKNNH